MNCTIEEHDVVLLRDGREATVISVCTDPLYYVVEVSEKVILKVKRKDIERITWKHRRMVAG